MHTYAVVYKDQISSFDESAWRGPASDAGELLTAEPAFIKIKTHCGCLQAIRSNEYKASPRHVCLSGQRGTEAFIRKVSK
ncbi:hypothetical protein MHYP_G00326220 [Metynnis hypsauchen]